MVIKTTVKGDWKKTEAFLEKGKQLNLDSKFDFYGSMGVAILSEATPKDTGKTADSWNYEVHKSGKKVKIVWTNDNLTSQGTPIAILIQYGHGTGTGGFVLGRDYINPAMRPVFDAMAENIWEEVTKD